MVRERIKPAVDGIADYIALRAADHLVGVAYLDPHIRARIARLERNRRAPIRYRYFRDVDQPVVLVVIVVLHGHVAEDAMPLKRAEVHGDILPDIEGPIHLKFVAHVGEVATQKIEWPIQRARTVETLCTPSACASSKKADSKDDEREPRDQSLHAANFRMDQPAWSSFAGQHSIAMTVRALPARRDLLSPCHYFSTALEAYYPSLIAQSSRLLKEREEMRCTSG